jgi:hypothetical protein
MLAPSHTGVTKQLVTSSAVLVSGRSLSSLGAVAGAPFASLTMDGVDHLR